MPQPCSPPELPGVRRFRPLAALGSAALLLLAACSTAATPAAPTNPPASPAPASPVNAASPQASPSLTGGSPLPSISPAVSSPVLLPSPSVAAYNGPTTSLEVGYNSPDPAYTPLWLAVDSGLFQQYGLAVDLQLLPTGTQSMAALLSNQLQFIQSGASTVLTPATTGADLTVLAIWLPVQNYVLDVSPDIQTPADLKGKTVAIDAVGDSAALATDLALRQVGLDPSTDVTVVAIGATPNRATALEANQVQATVLSPPTYLKVEEQGYKRLLDLAALHLPQAGQSTIAEKSWVTTNHDVAQRYIDALMAATLRTKRDKATALAVMSNHMQGYTEDELSQTYDFYAQEVWPDVPTPDPALLHDSIQALAQSTPQINNLDLTTLLDPSFVQAAQAQGIR